MHLMLMDCGCLCLFKSLPWRLMGGAALMIFVLGSDKDGIFSEGKGTSFE